MNITLEWVIQNATILPRLKTDLLKILDYATKNKLKKLNLTWENSKCMTIVLCSKGYPGSYQKNKIINLNQIKQDRSNFYNSCRH